MVMSRGSSILPASRAPPRKLEEYLPIGVAVTVRSSVNASLLRSSMCQEQKFGTMLMASGAVAIIRTCPPAPHQLHDDPTTLLHESGWVLKLRPRLGLEN